MGFVATSYSTSSAFVQAADEAWLLLRQAQNVRRDFLNISALITSLNSLYNMMIPAPSSSDTYAYAIYQTFSLSTETGLRILQICQSSSAVAYLLHTNVINEPGSFGKLYSAVGSIPDCLQDTCTAAIQCALFGDGTNACSNTTSLVRALQGYNGYMQNQGTLPVSLNAVAGAIQSFCTLQINDGYLKALLHYLKQNTVMSLPDTDLFTLSNSLLQDPTSTTALAELKLGLDVLNEYNPSGGNLTSMLNALQDVEFGKISECPKVCVNPMMVNNSPICPCVGICPWNQGNCVDPS